MQYTTITVSTMPQDMPHATMPSPATPPLCRQSSGILARFSRLRITLANMRKEFGLTLPQAVVAMVYGTMGGVLAILAWQLLVKLVN